MKQILTGCACLSLLFAPVFSAQAEQAQKVGKRVSVNDVALGKSGTLSGKAVDGQGKPLQDAKVSVRQNQKVVATTVTDSEGKFLIAGLETGIYEMQAGQGQGVFRAWDGEVAPPTAKKNVLIVSGATARSQSGAFVDPLDTITLGLSITGVALGAAALADGNEERIIVSP